MQEILSRMSAFDCVDIFVFPDDTIINIPVEEWPICDCLISFYSNGFPLEKAIEYAKLTNPFVLNDLDMQYALMHRFVHYGLCYDTQSFNCKTGAINTVVERFMFRKHSLLCK